VPGVAVSLYREELVKRLRHFPDSYRLGR